jgi:hypothetical protein
MSNSNKLDKKGMIKIKRRDYLSEKKETFYMNNEIKCGTFMNEKIDEIWRGKSKPIFSKPYPEKKYMINEILKKYQSSQDERKGYDYKYVLELTDLLGQKDKNFSKKRLELYNKRINNKKKIFINNTEKNLIQANKTANNFNKKKPITFMTNIYENTNFNKNKFYNSFYNNFYNKGNRIMNLKLNNNRDFDLYNKTSYNYNSPLKIASLKYLLNPKSKSCKKDNNIATSFYLTQFNTKDEDSFDTTSLVGKEAYLFSGDREKYHEYLQKEYKFFDQPKLRQAKFLFDKQKRIKLFKKLPNGKFLNYRREDPLKTEIFNKINREKKHYYYDFGLHKDYINNNRKKLERIKAKSNKKLNFYKDCHNILIRVKNILYE